MAGTISWSFKKFDRVDSTQKVAQEFVREGAEEGLVVLASTQAAGRGTKGRAWLSPRGGLYMSVILRPKRNDEITPER